MGEQDEDGGTPLATDGAGFLVPLADGRFAACRALRPHPEQRSALDPGSPLLRVDPEKPGPSIGSYPQYDEAVRAINDLLGNAGQTDYAAANDLLCKVSSSFRRTRPGTRDDVVKILTANSESLKAAGCEMSW